MQQTVACPNCGLQNASNQQFCVSCGAHLGNPQRPISHIPIVTGVVGTAQAQGGVPGQSIGTSGAAISRSPDRVEVKPTWGLAWGLFWRLLIIELFAAGLIFLGYMLVRLILGYNDIFGPW